MTKDEIRERLVELILSVPPFAIIPTRACGKATTQNSVVWVNHLAKHLIAHGVTLVTDKNDGCKWISVKDRLPDEREVLCYCENRYTTEIQVRYFSKNLKETSRDYFPRYDQERPGFFYSDLEYGLIEDTRVTHWMPLPTPPKEVE